MYALMMSKTVYVFEARVGRLFVDPKPSNHNGWKNTVVKLVSPAAFEVNTT